MGWIRLGAEQLSESITVVLNKRLLGHQSEVKFIF